VNRTSLRAAIAAATLTLTLTAASGPAHSAPSVARETALPSSAQVRAAWNTMRRWWQQPETRFASDVTKELMKLRLEQWRESGYTRCSWPLPSFLCAWAAPVGVAVGDARGRAMGVWSTSLVAPGQAPVDVLRAGRVYRFTCWTLGTAYASPRGFTDRTWLRRQGGGYVPRYWVYIGTALPASAGIPACGPA